ncbi:MAG TPA: hypothetical protein ENH94_03465 [Phycisphaerales bacterium]|nr:hypothetical protein [Phycisphaerales bacterium]
MDNFWKKYLFVLLLTLAVMGADAFAQINVSAQIDGKAEVYVGGQFNYYIVIDGASQAGQVDMSPLSKFSPKYAGKRSTTRNRAKRFVVVYSLTAIEAGALKIPAVKVVVGGRTYTTNPVTVNVKEPSRSDKIELAMDVSRKKCYVGEPIVLTVKWFIHEDLLKVRNGVRDFSFNVPAYVSGDFYVEDVDGQGVRQANLEVNGLGVFYSTQNVRYKGRAGTMVSFSKVLIPKKAGRTRLGASSVSVKLATGSRRGIWGREMEYDTFMARSGGIQLDVLPLPDVSKPDGFYGLIGKYEISASAKPVRVNVGDPITLTIKAGGNKYLKPVKRPDLNAVSGFAGNFKTSTEQSEAVIRNDFKIFTQTIRANSADVTEIPPIPLVYFDSEKGRYVTAFSEAIPLDVAATTNVTAADAEGYSFVPATREIEAFKRGISAHYEKADALEDMGFSISAAIASPGYFSFWALPFGAFLISLAVRFAGQNSPEKMTARRKRAAAKNAIGKLKGSAEDGLSETLVTAMRGYIGDRFDLTSGSLTPLECERIIAGRTGDGELAGEYRAVMDRCERSSYAGASAEIDASVVERVVEMIGMIEKRAGR